MNFRKRSLILVALTLFSGFFHPLIAQNLDPVAISHPSPESWPSYHGDYSGRRHSQLTQITPQNVAYLTLAWAFQTNQTAAIKSTPLLVDGILYFTVPDNIWAVDARSGLDIAVSDWRASSVTILLGDGKGSFGHTWSFPLRMRGTKPHIAAADFNGDSAWILL